MNIKSKKAKLQNFINSKFGSRKFQVLILAVVAFYTSPKFTADHLTFAFCAYMGFNVLQKWIEKK